MGIIRSKLSIPGRTILKPSTLKRPKRSLRSKIVIFLLSVIALGSLLMLAFPYLPKLAYWINRPHIDPTSYQQAAKATKTGEQPVNPEPAKPGNRLILPSIGLDTQIIEGRNIYAIGKNQGAWRETSSINPTVDGNIVLAGHRFIYNVRNTGVFYNLPELNIGDKLYIRWDNKMYEYEVYNSRSVLPTQVDIRDADPAVARKLTMYTCYPLGSTAKRFVIEAKQL